MRLAPDSSSAASLVIRRPAPSGNSDADRIPLIRSVAPGVIASTAPSLVCFGVAGLELPDVHGLGALVALLSVERYGRALLERPSAATPDWWTNRSLPASSGVMKPKRLSSLNHLTVPVGIATSAVDCCVREGACRATIARKTLAHPARAPLRPRPRQHRRRAQIPRARASRLRARVT